MRDRIGTTLSHLQEGIAGVRVVQAFGREDVEVGAVRGTATATLYDSHMRSVRISAWYLPVIEFAGCGHHRAGRRHRRAGSCTTDIVTVGTVAFFVLTLSNLFEPVQQLSQLFNMVQSAGAGLNKLFELLDTPRRRGRAARRVDLPAAG